MVSTDRLSTRNLTAMGMAAAMALVLGLIGKALPLQLPQGGSITLETLPIFFIAFYGSPRLGCLTGLLVGLLQLLFGAFILHPIQVILDYPLPFALLGLSALFPRVPRLGILIGSALRWLSHVVSGAIFFGSFAPEGTGVWVYSILYNSSYIVPETLLALLIVPFLLRRISSHIRPQ